MTWEEIVQLEPRLFAFPQIARLAGELDSDGTNDRFYIEVKHLFLPLVGWSRNPPGLVERELPNPVCLSHPDLCWNVLERDRLIALEPEEIRSLYDCEVYNAVYDHLLAIYETAQDLAMDVAHDDF